MIYRFGSIELDEAGGELRRDGQTVAIQPKPLALLTLLIEERHRIVPNDELLDRLWPGETVTPNSLSRAVSVARSAIGDGGRTGHIRSYTRRGYRFHGDVVELGGDELPTPSEAPPLADEGDGTIPFVGRQEAVARLRAAWVRAAKGRGGIALVSGPAGIGKTRLLQVFGRDVERRGGLVLQGRALEQEGEPAFWVWAQVLRRLREEDPESLEVPGLVDTGELAALMPELGAPASAAAGQLPAEQRRFVFFDAVAQGLRRAARRRPLLVLFEDLHWADSASLRLLEHLAFELAGAPVLLGATVRAEPPGRDNPAHQTLSVLRRQERCEPVPLEGLAPEEVGELTARLMGDAPPELARRLHARTDGVPLFLREALRRLGEAGGSDPAQVLDSEAPLGEVDWVGDALAGLSEPCRAAVEAASVMGREFTLPVAAGIAGLERDEVLDLLDEAVAAGVVEAEVRSPARYRFVHDLFREATYGGLSPGARVRLHQRAAQQLERLHADDLDRVASELAHHHHQALAVADPDEAYRAAARAAERCFSLSAYEKAVLHWDQARAALDHSERSDPERRLTTLLALGEASRLCGERGRRRQHFGEALELARSLERPEAFAMAAIGLCDLAEWGVRDDTARAALEEAVGLPGRAAPELQAMMLTRLGYLDSLFDRERAEKHLRRAVKLARRLAASDLLEEALYGLHFLLGGPDGLEERGEILGELRGAASAARDPVASVIAVLDVACDRLELGDPAGATELRREADATAGQPPHPRTVWHRLVYDTGLALMEGRLDEVEGRAEEARALGRRIQHPYANGCHAAHMAQLHAARGEHEALLALMEPALPAQQGPREWVRVLVARSRRALGMDSALEPYEDVMGRGLDVIPRNLRWMATLVELAHCCADLEDTARAGELIELLAPFEQHHGVMPMVICYGGPVAWALARLHELLGRTEEAEELYREALASVPGARPTEAALRLEHGVLQRRRGQRSAAREQLAAAAALAADLGLRGVEQEASRRLSS